MIGCAPNTWDFFPSPSPFFPFFFRHPSIFLSFQLCHRSKINLKCVCDWFLWYIFLLRRYLSRHRSLAQEKDAQADQDLMPDLTSILYYHFRFNWWGRTNSLFARTPAFSTTTFVSTGVQALPLRSWDFTRVFNAAWVGRLFLCQRGLRSQLTTSSGSLARAIFLIT